jgi:hypothetical protein
MQPKLAIITVTGCHLIPVIYVGVIGNVRRGTSVIEPSARH